MLLTVAALMCPLAIGGGSGALGKKVGAGVCSHRTSGGCSIQIIEAASIKHSAPACMASDASVVHPLRADWSHVLSSVLNISSSGTGPLLPLQTPLARDLIRGKRSKRTSAAYKGG
jgi:hypothetical protein